MRGGALESPTTDDLARDPSRVPAVSTDRFPAQRTALGAATVELPPRCRRGSAGCVPELVGVRLVEHPPAPPADSALSARQWRLVRSAVTAAVFVLLTAFGVHLGLGGASAPAAVAPEEPVGAVPAGVVPAVAPPRLAPPPARPPSARPPSAGHATAGHPGHVRAVDRSGSPAGSR